MAALPVLSRL